MINVLFICHGNICRSPMAEYIFRDMVQRQGLAQRFHIASAATSREEIGNDVYPPARAELRAHGVPVGHRAAVQVTPRDYDAYDWLLTMDETTRATSAASSRTTRTARSVRCCRLWGSSAASPTRGTPMISARRMPTSCAAARRFWSICAAAEIFKRTTAPDGAVIPVYGAISGSKRPSLSASPAR